jgi:hypothetical protein
MAARRRQAVHRELSLREKHTIETRPHEERRHTDRVSPLLRLALLSDWRRAPGRVSD